MMSYTCSKVVEVCIYTLLCSSHLRWSSSLRLIVSHLQHIVSQSHARVKRIVVAISESQKMEINNWERNKNSISHQFLIVFFCLCLRKEDANKDPNKSNINVIIIYKSWMNLVSSKNNFCYVDWNSHTFLDTFFFKQFYFLFWRFYTGRWNKNKRLLQIYNWTDFNIEQFTCCGIENHLSQAYDSVMIWMQKAGIIV